MGFLFVVISKGAIQKLSTVSYIDLMFVFSFFWRFMVCNNIVKVKLLATNNKISIIEKNKPGISHASQRLARTIKSKCEIAGLFHLQKIWRGLYIIGQPGIATPHRRKV